MEQRTETTTTKTQTRTHPEGYSIILVYNVS